MPVLGDAAIIGHSQCAATQEFPSHCTPKPFALLCLCHLQVLTLSNTSLSFSSALPAVCRWEAVCSSCSQALLLWLLGTGLLEYPAQALIQAAVVWHPRGKREAGHRERELECRSLLLGHRDVMDKNSLAKNMKWHSGNTTMQYSTHNCTGCRIPYTTAKWSKLHQNKKPKQRQTSQ